MTVNNALIDKLQFDDGKNSIEANVEKSKFKNNKFLRKYKHFSVFQVFQNDLFNDSNGYLFLFNSEIHNDGELKAFEIISEKETDIKLNVKYHIVLLF
jgi:hypothetical protein